MEASQAAGSRLAQEAFLSVARTAALLGDDVDRLLAPHGLSQPQYNVLRILRGAGEAGLCRHEIRERLISRMPDVTRLVDRLEQAGLVARERGESDRRQMRARITPSGLALLARLDESVRALHEGQFAALPPEERAQLVALLQQVRVPRGDGASGVDLCAG